MEDMQVSMGMFNLRGVAAAVVVAEAVAEASTGHHRQLGVVGAWRRGAEWRRIISDRSRMKLTTIGAKSMSQGTIAR